MDDDTKRLASHGPITDYITCISIEDPKG